MNSIFTIRLLRDVMTLSKGKPPAQQPYFGSDAEIYLTPEYLRGNSLADTVKPSLNAVRVFDKETIILWDGSNAGEIFWSKSGILASTMSKITHTKTFDEKYFFYALKNCESYIKSQTSGSGIPHVDKEILDKIEIVEFLKPEQSKIAEILSTVDKAIEQTEALIAKQQRIKTGLMQDLLTKGIDENGNLRSEKTHKFKDSPLGRIPEAWEVKQLSETTCNLITYGIVQPGVYCDDGVPFVQTKDLSKGALDINQMDRTSAEIHSSYKRSSIKTGDLVIGIRASVGLVAEIPRTLNNTNISRGVARLSPSENTVGRYLFWIIQSYNVQKSINMEIKGSTYPEITLPALRSILIPIPSHKEQELISYKIDAISVLIDESYKNLKKLHSIKTALMQDLLTGKVRVTPLLNNEVQNE